MSTKPSALLTARLVAEVKAIDVEMANLTEERAKRVRLLAKHDTGKHLTPEGTFTVSENNVYDKDAILAALSPGQVKRCSVLRLDNPTVKRLYPDAYAGAKVNKGHKVSVA